MTFLNTLICHKTLCRQSGSISWILIGLLELCTTMRSYINCLKKIDKLSRNIKVQTVCMIWRKFRCFFFLEWEYLLKWVRKWNWYTDLKFQACLLHSFLHICPWERYESLSSFPQLWVILTKFCSLGWQGENNSEFKNNCGWG